MKNQDWKLKYSDLKLKFHDAVDVAFRLGYEQGAQGAQMQQAQQQQAEAQAAQQQAAMGGQPGQDMNNPESPDGSNGSELDSHINQLEGMLGQSKPGSMEQEGLQKSIAGIKEFQLDLKQKYEMKKAEKAINSIGNSMKPKFAFSKSATKNLSESGKKALNDQEKIVDELMKSFSEEEKKAAEAINKTLSFEQLLKG
jgi:hypothetical protein